MNQFGILAYPAHHSLSPAMHNAVFSKNKMNAVYGRYEISPENLGKFMKNWRTDEKKMGLSVSIPHKEAVQKYCDVIDESATIIGAINTIYKENNSLLVLGTNTDWLGFKKSLETQYDAKNKRYLVLGAGGASRAIVYALLKMKAKQIYIWNRTEEKTLELVKSFSKISADVLLAKTEKLPEISLETDCIINTTSVGMVGNLESFSPFPKELFQSFHTAFDIVYTPKNTIFLKDCIHAGGIGLSGENMLLFQGIEQSKIFSHQCKKNISDEQREKTMKMGLEKSMRKMEDWIPPSLSSDEKKNILGTIVKRKKEELFLAREFLLEKKEELGNNKKQEKQEKQGKQQTEMKHFSFFKALQKQKKSPHLIAEIKPASPSKGKIFSDEDSVENIAQMYEKNGVSCISVLTDFTFFGATIENVKKAYSSVSLPLLRKDFIVDISQIDEAKYFGASAILLMRSVLSAEKIEEFLQHAQKKQLDCLVEVHDETELRDVLENTSAQIIGVNTRDLKTLQINPENFQTLLNIAKTYSNFSEKIWIAESGISSASDIKNYANEADAILVGTGILLSDEREKKVRELVG